MVVIMQLQPLQKRNERMRDLNSDWTETPTEYERHLSPDMLV